MATIIKRNDKQCVVYWYLDDTNKRKQKWETYDSKKEASARQSFIKYYQKTNGAVIVPMQKELGEIQVTEEQEQTIDDEVLGSTNADITFAEFLEIFVDIYGVSKWSASTYSGKTSAIKHYIEPLIGDWKLKDITTKKLSKYYNDLLSYPEVGRPNQKAPKRCVRPANIKKIHDIIRCALNQAILWEYLDTRMRNPASMATLPKRTKNVRDVWDIEVFKRAIAVVDDDLLHIAMQLAFSCSMRIGEVLGLCWSDVFIDDEALRNENARVTITKELTRVTVEAMKKLNDKDIIKVFPTQKPTGTSRLVLKTPKTESSVRVVWLPKTVTMLLRQYKDAQDKQKDFLGSAYTDHNLVIALDNGNPVESNYIRKKFNELIAEHNLPEVVFHSLRHLSTSYKLKMTNGDVKSVQGDTGHAEVEMVMDVYARVIDEDRRLNAQKMDKHFYEGLNESTKDSSQSDNNKEDEFFNNLIDFLSKGDNKERLQQALNLANK